MVSAVSFSYSPGVQCLIPLFYVAWLDRVLTPSEIQALKKKAVKLPFLTEEDKVILMGWTNPAKPPSKHLFKYWEIELKNAAETLHVESGNSLVDLGLTMARNATYNTPAEDSIDWDAPNIREGLEEIENLLGAINVNTYLSIFPEEATKHQQFAEKQQTSFDVAEMKAILDDDYPEIRDRMRTLLSDPAFAYHTLRNKDEYRNQVLAWCKLLADQGLGALSYPDEYGGKDDMGTYAAVFEMLGYHDLSLTIKFGVQFGLFGGSVLWLGTKRHHDKYLKDTGTLKLTGCFAMTETGHGSNVRGLETTAIYDATTQEFIVNSPSKNAGKEYIGNALHGRMASVFAQLIVNGENHGVHAILVPLRDAEGTLLKGIRVEDCGYKLGLNGVDNGRIWFDQVRVPRENLLNRFGDVSPEGIYTSPIENPSRRFFTMLGTLVGGRVCVPRAGLSATKSGLAIAIKYALKRRQFSASYNEPETLLLDYPSHQRRLMPLLAKTYALDFALTYLTKRYVERTEEDIREIETLAAGLKSYATWFTTETLQECREACGGKGYLAENRFADLKADTDIFTTFEGDNTVLMQLVAKGVLSDFKKEFHEEGNMAVLRYLGSRISTAISNPFTARNTDRNHLLDSKFHLNAFELRARKLLYSLADRLRGWIKEGFSAYDAALKCQTHMLALANAFVEQIVLEQFLKVIASVESDNVKNILTKLCNLYALSTLEQHKGWFLEQDYFTGGKTKAIRRVVDDLCAALRKDAGSLVEAFAIPDQILAADITLEKE